MICHRTVLRIAALFCLLGTTVSVPAQMASTTAANARVESLLQRMTREEKIQLIAGTGMGTAAIPRLGIPAFAMTDGPSGARGNPPSTAYAAGVGLAATFDTDLARHIGREIGRDTKARNTRILLGPGVNIFRSPLNGRNFEYFGEDPFLSGKIAVGYILGVQSVGVVATVKHFVGNESEFARNTSDSNIDERTLREIYLPPFEMAVKEAKVGAVMDSYNKLNGLYLTQNPSLNTDILRNEWGFSGILMSDWFATHDTLGAANGGLDLEMPSGQFFNTRTLTPFLEKGEISKETLDAKVRRILHLAIRMGWLDTPAGDSTLPRYNVVGKQASLQSAREGIVLLKNRSRLLPLDSKHIKTIAVIGPDAFPAVPTGGGSGRVAAFAPISILTGLGDAIGLNGTVLYARGLPTLAQIARATRFTQSADGTKPGLTVEAFDNPELRGDAVSMRVEPFISFGRTFFEGIGEESDDAGGFGGMRPAKPTFSRWTGYYTVAKAGSYEIFVQRSEEFRLFVDDILVMDNWDFARTTVVQKQMSFAAGIHKIVFEEAKIFPFGTGQARLGIYATGSLVDAETLALAKRADAVVLAVGYDHVTETEGTDRDFALPPGQTDLIREVARVNKNVIVAITAGGSVETASWRDAVGAILALHYPGQEGGTAFAEILLGRTNPSGRLPYTWHNRLEDNPAQANYYYSDPTTQKIAYTEGVFIGYRAAGRGIAPLYPFGYGLSYTTFGYSHVQIIPQSGGWNVAFDVTNTGTTAGSDVPQIYVAPSKSPVARPLRELKGFARVVLAAGATKRVIVHLTPRDLAYWDTATKRWTAPAGNYEIQIGKSAQEIVLRIPLALKVGVTLKP